MFYMHFHCSRKDLTRSILPQSIVTFIGLLSATLLLSGCATKADYNYFNDAKKLGNSGFEAVLQGNGKLARGRFDQSTKTLSAGVQEHVKKSKRRASWKRGATWITTIAAAVGAAHVAADASQSAQTQHQQNQVNSFLNDTGQYLGQFVMAMEDQIARAQYSVLNEDARSVDWNAWRALVISDHPIAESVVRIVLPGGGHCSGFYIQPKVVATAAHCFDSGGHVRVLHEYSKDGEKFMKGENLENPVLGYIRHPLYKNNASCRFRNSSGGCIPYDVAFIATKYANRHYFPLYAKLPASGTTAFNIGYSGDLNRGFFKRIDYGCGVNANRIKVSKDFVILYDCDSHGGNSGGPVVAVAPGERGSHLGVIGVHAASVRDQKARTAGRAKAAYLGVGKAIYRKLITAYPGTGRADLLDGL